MTFQTGSKRYDNGLIEGLTRRQRNRNCERFGSFVEKEAVYNEEIKTSYLERYEHANTITTYMTHFND